MYMKNTIVKSAMLSQKLDHTANVRAEKIVSSQEFERISFEKLKPKKGETISRT